MLTRNSLMISAATMMGFIMEGFHDAAKSTQEANKVLNQIGNLRGVGADALYREIVEEIAVPMAICVETAVDLGMNFDGVFEYDVASRVGHNLYATAFTGDLEKYKSFVFPVSSGTGRFVNCDSGNLLYCLRDYFFQPVTKQHGEFHSYVKECEKEFYKRLKNASLPYTESWQDVYQSANLLQELCYSLSSAAGWWNDLHTGEPLPLTQERVGDKLMLIVSEVAEAKEGHRKNLMDTHLPHRQNFEVELADAIIRICDLAGAAGLDLGGALVEKLQYNANREDHKLSNRRAEGGKKT